MLRSTWAEMPGTGASPHVLLVQWSQAQWGPSLARGGSVRVERDLDTDFS